MAPLTRCFLVFLIAAVITRVRGLAVLGLLGSRCCRFLCRTGRGDCTVHPYPEGKMKSVTTEQFPHVTHTAGFKYWWWLCHYAESTGRCRCTKTNPPALGFFLGGASSSDEESSLVDSAAAAGFADTGLTGACQKKSCPIVLEWCCEILCCTLGGSSSSESELSSVLLSSFFWAATLLRPTDLVVGVGAAPVLASTIKGHVELCQHCLFVCFF